MRLDRAVNVLENLPPIEVCEVGEVYFVLLPCLRPIKTKGY